MKNRSSLMKCVFLSVFGVPLVTGVAQAQARLDYPGQDPGPPFYARIRQGWVVHTDQWAAIAFYRQPSCVPPGFNLLNLFNPPAAFGCTLTVDGFLLYDQVAPPPGTVPKQVESFGLGAVPVAFVLWPELQAAMADGVLTIGELEALPSLRVLTATFLHESFHASGGAQRVQLMLVASGPGFFLQVLATGTGQLSPPTNVIIRLD